jgi:protocatechuate 3,4-dioxygenase beta subunit
MFRIKTVFAFALQLCYLTYHSSKAVDPLTLTGLLLDDNSNPIEGGKVQIWQADENGNYDHPLNSVLGGQLDPSFQYYGTATTAADGNYTFTTIRPGRYVQRPVIHVHFKIFVDGTLEHTTQFYFTDDGVADVSIYSDTIVVTPVDNGDGSMTATKNLVINMGGGGDAQITAKQPAGPFYPCEDFFDLGPNLILNDRRRKARGLRGGQKAKEIMKSLVTRWG